MRILIVEPEASGHRMSLYVRHIVRATLRRGWSPHLLTTQEATAHPAFELVQREAEGRLPVHLMPSIRRLHRIDAVSLSVEQWRQYEAMSTGYRRIDPKARPDHIYLANFDYCDKIMAIRGSPFGSTPLSGLLMSIRHHQRAMEIGPASRNDRVYEWLFQRLLQHPAVRRVAVIDEAFLEYASRTRHPAYDKLRFVPDPGELVGTETREAARKSLGIAPERFVLLVYGSLSSRKGIRQLLDSLQGDYFTHGTVLFAGAPDRATCNLLETPPVRALMNRGRLITELGFCDPSKEYRVFRASDAVWVAYSRGFYGSSGVFYQAGSIGLPVLTPPYGLLRWLTERYRNGLCCDPDNPAEVASAIRSLMDQPALRERLGANGIAVAEAHTGNLFGDAVCDMILEF